MYFSTRNGYLQSRTQIVNNDKVVTGSPNFLALPSYFFGKIKVSVQNLYRVGKRLCTVLTSSIIHDSIPAIVHKFQIWHQPSFAQDFKLFFLFRKKKREDDTQKI